MKQGLYSLVPASRREGFAAIAEEIFESVGKYLSGMFILATMNGAFTFLLGGGPIEMFCAFAGAGFGNYLRCKLTKHHFTLFLSIVTSVSLACLVYAGLLKIGELLFDISIQHEAGYICAMLFIIPGFPFITSGF